MKFRSWVIVLLSTFSFSACNSQSAGVKNLGVDDFEKGIAKGNVQLVDVRTPEEFTEKHISRAVNINLNGSDFEKQMNGLDKSKPTYIYCLAGSRSKKASEWASAHGFKEVYNLEGGINGWLASNKHVETATGAPMSEGMSFDDYLSHIKSSNKVVLVDFNAVWCGPCKIIKPYVQKTVKKNSDKVELFDIDVDKNPAISKAMNIQGIPLLIMYKGGKEVWRNLGVIDESDLAEKVQQFIK